MILSKTIMSSQLQGQKCEKILIKLLLCEKNYHPLKQNMMEKI